MLTVIFEQLSDAIVVLGEDGRMVYGNAVAAHMMGFDSPAALRASRPEDIWNRFEVLDDTGRPLPVDELPGRRVLRTGGTAGPFRIRYRDKRAGEERWTQLFTSTIRDDATGETLAVLQFRDVTQQERANDALQFLAEASAVLAGSLDYDETLSHLARLAVPRIADWCSVEMVTPDGSIRTLAVAHVDPEKVAMAHELGRRYPPDPNAEHGTALVIRTGRPELMADIPDELLEAVSPDPELLAILRDLGLRSSMSVPIKARGRTLGAINLVSAESGRRFDEQQLTLAEDLANRAAIAVDNAHLYRQATRAATELQTVLAQMSDAVLITDAEARVTFVNESVARLFGPIPIGSSVGSMPADVEILTPEDKPYPVDRLPTVLALHGEPVEGLIWKIRRKDGSVVVLATSAAAVKSPEGRVLGAVAVSRDITARFEFDRQKDDFLLSASHDLKNPLTLIKGVAQMLMMHAGRPGAVDANSFKDGLRRIDETASRMSRAINEMLDVSRIQMGRPIAIEPASTDLVELLRQAVDEQLAAQETVSVTVFSEVDSLRGEWDPLRLERVFANLLSNAVKFSPDGAEVVVRVAETGGETNEAVVSFTDRGVGIPQSDLPFVFEQFHRGHNVAGRIAGTGIGLAGSRQIVEQHGGTISVTSKEGEGSTFTLRLPLRAPRTEMRT